MWGPQANRTHPEPAGEGAGWICPQAIHKETLTTRHSNPHSEHVLVGHNSCSRN